MTPSTPQQALPQLPASVPPPPVFGSAPQGKKPGVKSSQPTFLGSDTMASPGNLGGKKLVGE
jgi:hypothetical protein